MPVGIDEHVGDVLGVAHLERAAAHSRGAGCTGRRIRPLFEVGSNLRQRFPSAPARQPAVWAQFSPLMSWTSDAPRPGEQGRDHPAHALARARRRESEHVLRARMAEVRPRVPFVALEDPEEDPVTFEKVRGLHLAIVGPTR